MPSNLPDTIGRYEVLSRLGRGGMGVVYRGRDPRIGGRFVAIKLLHVVEHELVDRFLQEAATAGVLDHPNIVRVYDFGEHLGDPYIVMEFVEGVTLGELIRARSPLALARKLEIIRDIALGLDYAHNAGVVHRDVKPANLMIKNDGSVKILDFGIARVANTGMTQVGAQLGTPNYMSPEQIDAKPVDRRSDVFGLGLVFYELLALQPAFSGKSTSQVMAQILTQSPEPVDRLCPGLDPAIARIVNTAIEKDPERRYQSLAGFAGDIDEIRRRMRAADETVVSRLDLPQREPAPETITAILRQARHDLESGNFSSAVRAASEILVKDPSNDEARSLSREALAALDEFRAKEEHEKNARRMIAAQEQAFRNGQIDTALAALDHFTPRHPLVTAAAARLRAEAEEIELQRRADEQRHLAQARWAARELETARESVHGHRYDEAIATLEHLKQVCPDLAGVDDVLLRARAGLAAAAADAKRRRDVANLVARADGEERQNKLEAARTLFQNALQLEPGHTEALTGLARIEATVERAREEHRRRVERERHIEATVRAAFAQSDSGDHNAALRVLDTVGGSDARVAEARSVVEARLRAAEEATRLRAAEARRINEERQRFEEAEEKRRLEEAAESRRLREAAERRRLEESAERRRLEETEARRRAEEEEREAQRSSVQPATEVVAAEETLIRPGQDAEPVPTVVHRPPTDRFEGEAAPRKSNFRYVAAAAVFILVAGGYSWYVSDPSGPVARPTVARDETDGPTATPQPPASPTPNASAGEPPKATVVPLPSSTPRPAVSPTAEAERVRIAEIERMLGRGELVTGADRITVSMRQFGRSKALEDLEERARNLAKSKAADAKQRAERAGRSNLADFKRGEQQMADGASAERGRESLSRIVAVYGDAETLFERAADASVPPAPPTLPTTPALTPTATPITTPVPPAPSAPTPSPTAVVRRPVMDNDDAQGLLQALANLWEKFDPKQLAQIYPNIMNLDTDKSRLATLKQVNSRCSLTFGKVDVRPNDKSEDVLLVADSERVCQPKTGSRFDPLHETNFVTVHKVGNQWQVVGWATQVIKR